MGLLAGGGPRTADAGLVAAAGERLLSADGFQVLADPALQVGPLWLLVVGTGSRLARLVGLAPETGAGLLGAWTVLAALALLDRCSARRSTAARCGLLVQVALGGALAVGLGAGHLEDLMAVLLVAGAAAALHRDAPVPAGLLVGAAVCTKLWALIALAALLCAPGASARARSTAAACGVVAALHLPQLSAARTHELTWQVAEPSLVALVVPAGTAVGAPGRLLLLVAALLVALLLRGSAWDARVVWSVPAAVVLARPVTDPTSCPTTGRPGPCRWRCSCGRPTSRCSRRPSPRRPASPSCWC